jgi:hypothetical protein
MNEREFEDAIVELDKALDFCPSDERIKQMLGECRYKKSKANVFKSLIARGDALLAKGAASLPDALEAYEAARKMGYDNSSANLKISEASNRRARAADMLKERGLRYLDYGECFLAEKYLLLADKLLADATLGAKIAKARQCQR